MSQAAAAKSTAASDFKNAFSVESVNLITETAIHFFWLLIKAAGKHSEGEKKPEEEKPLRVLNQATVCFVIY